MLQAMDALKAHNGAGRPLFQRTGAVHQCALDLSEEIEGDALVASALTHVLHLLDFIEERSSLTSVAQTGINQALETAVRSQATFETLAGSWANLQTVAEPPGRNTKGNIRFPPVSETSFAHYGDSMVSTHVQDFLSDALQEAIRIRASLCLFSHQVNPDETPGDDGEITPTRLMWNHFAAMHNSRRAVHQCALDLSEEIEGDALVASALTHVLHLLDFIEERSSLTSVAQTGINQALETAVRSQATFETLAGSWQTIRQIFKVLLSPSADCGVQPLHPTPALPCRSRTSGR